MKNKERLILVVSGVILLLAVATFFSYSYFSVNNTVSNNLVMNITIGGGNAGTFSVNKGSNVTMNVLTADMLNSTVGSAAATANSNLTVKLTSTNNLRCSYEVYWVWNTGASSYTKTTNASNEFTVQGSTSSGLQALETQVANYSNKTYLGTFSITANNSTTTQVWNFTSKFYNLNLNQDSHAGKSYSGRFEISSDNVSCGAA